jgi:inosine-uridine nucleoside N-ribohydrolase
VNAASEANIYNDPEAAEIVFNAGWPVTMVGLDVGDQTLATRPFIAELAKTHGPQNAFVVQILNFLEDLSEKYGYSGVPLYDPLAVGVTLDPTLVETRAMRVDVETRGEFTRGETVANRHNAVERTVPQDNRYIITGIEHVRPNLRVAVGVNAKRFLEIFRSRMAGR